MASMSQLCASSPWGQSRKSVKVPVDRRALRLRLPLFLRPLLFSLLSTPSHVPSSSDTSDVRRLTSRRSLALGKCSPWTSASLKANSFSASSSTTPSTQMLTLRFNSCWHDCRSSSSASSPSSCWCPEVAEGRLPFKQLRSWIGLSEEVEGLGEEGGDNTSGLVLLRLLLREDEPREDTDLPPAPVGVDGVIAVPTGTPVSTSTATPLLVSAALGSAVCIRIMASSVNMRSARFIVSKAVKFRRLCAMLQQLLLVLLLLSEEEEEEVLASCICASPRSSRACAMYISSP
mmetsp:Transcript_19522/g.33144  ORF Transcript_19522/g.33144 Transcript_19522/m.33144 type:complete len:289 (-) Transcript_19522:191-1057(-)